MSSPEEQVDPETQVEPEKKIQRSSLLDQPKTVTEGETSDEDNDVVFREKSAIREESWITTDSDIKDANRKICIVTTAALPWRTGTAVNPLLRALYLTRGRPKDHVTLVIPWLDEADDRAKTLGEEHREMTTQEKQEDWIREYCRERAGCPDEEKNLKIVFYKSRYYASFGSIFADEDICALIPEEEADVAILEEPEHLNWLRVPKPYEGEPENDDKEHGTSKSPTAKEKTELGWKFKFRHVVGIVHTNYKAYTEAYGQGAHYITAPMLNALNSIVIRAYCHRVILLSETLPSLCPYKEITRNVHGVSKVFFEEQKAESRSDDDQDTNSQGQKYSPVYFVGKTIWAKGFDRILELEKLYRKNHNEYFKIDIYGAGGDQEAIKRAFFGRMPQKQQADTTEDTDADTAEIFSWNDSMRGHMSSASHESERRNNSDDHKRYTQQSPSSGNGEQNQQNSFVGGLVGGITQRVLPLSVLGDLTKHTLETTKATAHAGVSVAKNIVEAGKHVAFIPGSPAQQSNKEADTDSKQKMVFAPPRSADEFRREPIPARFLGSKDHALIRHIPEHKVFLNCSITEVLCTTTAEALAMGKFVILPKHPSNTFFYQFPNCLAYSDMDDCLSKLEWALENNPKTLSKEHAHVLSWEGATDRLYEAAAITKDEQDEWEETGKIQGDEDAARFHVETGMKGLLIHKYFGGVLKNDEPEKSAKTKGSEGEN